MCCDQILISARWMLCRFDARLSSVISGPVFRRSGLESVSMRRRYKLLRTVRALPVAVALVVCLAPIEAQSYKATVLEQMGQVSVQAGGYLVALSRGGSISPQQIIVAGPDGYAKFQVSDGSTFEVFSNSRVVFRENLGNWKDLLNVIIGHIKVFIQHEPGKPNY